MSTKRTISQDDSSRLRELKKHTKKAKDVVGDLDYIDRIPKLPNRRKMIFPYGDNGKPLPWGSGGWK